MSNELSVVSSEDALHVLWVLDGQGTQAGAFTRSLIETCLRADTGNLNKVATVFPGIAGAVGLYKQRGGREALYSIAGLALSEAR